MAQRFTLNKPVATDSPTLEVENNLAPGTHVFTLVVVDESGNQSAAARASIVVRNRTTGPIPGGPIVVDPTRPGPVIVTRPNN